MARLQDLLAQKATLDRQIAETQRKERSAAIAHIKTLMEQYELTPADVGGAAKRGRPAGKRAASATSKAGSGKVRASTMKGTKVAPKFRNKATGETWSGRGLQPRWLKTALAGGKKLADFAV
jgi:DNA-binding protein H-NS